MTQGANSNDAKVDAIIGAILTIVGFVLVVVFTAVIWTRALGLVAFPIGLVGAFLLYVGRQCTSRAKARRLFQGDRAPTQAVLQDDRAPVVYLRSFDQNSSFASGGSYTVELELAEAVSPIGPMVAIGKLDEHMERTTAEHKAKEG